MLLEKSMHSIDLFKKTETIEQCTWITNDILTNSDLTHPTFFLQGTLLKGDVETDLFLLQLVPWPIICDPMPFI